MQLSVSTNSIMNRRDLLKAASLLPFVGTTPDLVVQTTPAVRTRSVRMAYIGDTHIMPQRKPVNGVAEAFRHLQNQSDKPAFILHGGDVIMDALSRDKSAVQKQWDVWQEVVKAECSLPLEYCIGNHDIWGVADAKADTRYGKAWAMEQFGITKRYRSFDKNGWHFVVLDSVHPKPDGSWYTGIIDDEQLDWLKKDLQQTDPNTPVLVLSHIPILSSTVLVFNDRNPAKHPDTQILGSLLHADSSSLVELLHKFPNVKAALSGHTHLLDRVDYNQVSYFCNGAISGNWWNSDTYHETKAGYALFDLYTDGTIERTYVAFNA